MQLSIERLDMLDPSSALGQQWEALVAAQPASGCMQSLHWAALKRRQGLRVLHLGIFDGSRLVGGGLWYTTAELTTPGVLIAPEGPVVDWTSEQRGALLRPLVAAAREIAPEFNAVAIRIEPRLTPPRPRELRDFRRAPVDLLPVETLYYDLRAEPQSLLAAMHPKCRYNIGLATRRGVSIREEHDPAAVHQFYPLLAEAGQRDAFFVEPLEFFISLTETLCPAGIARFLFAEHEGTLLGGLLLLTYGSRATYLYGGISNQQRQLMAGYALQWAAIQAAQRAGCTVYDFYGYESSGDPTHLYASFSRFKRQFGGDVQRFIGAHEQYLLDHVANAVVRLAQAARQPSVGG